MAIDANKMIKIRSYERGSVILKMEGFRRELPAYNSVISIPFDKLEQLYYTPGVIPMIKSGIIDIEDDEAKIAPVLASITSTNSHSGL